MKRPEPLTVFFVLLTAALVMSVTSSVEAATPSALRAKLTALKKAPPKCSAQACVDAKKNAVRKLQWKVKVAEMSPEQRKAMRDKWKTKRASSTPAQRKAAVAKAAARKADQAAVAAACDESAAAEKAAHEAPVLVTEAPPALATPVASPTPVATATPVAIVAPAPPARPTCDDPSVCVPCTEGKRCAACVLTPTGRVRFLDNLSRFERDLAEALMARGMSPEAATEAARAEQHKLDAYAGMNDDQIARLRSGQLAHDDAEVRMAAAAGRRFFGEARLAADKALRAERAKPVLARAATPAPQVSSR